jgi:antitoxin VapB
LQHPLIYTKAVMPIDVNHQEADVLTRKFAAMAGVGITEAIVIAMKALAAVARQR